MRKPSIKANPEGPYELLNDAKAKPGYDRDALEKMELLTILEQRLANLLGMQGDLEKSLLNVNEQQLQSQSFLYIRLSVLSFFDPGS